MSSAPITITPADALARLNERIEAYRSTTGRVAIKVLSQKAAQLLFGNRESKYGAAFPGLIERFRKEKPGDSAIMDSARARSFRLGRRTFTTSGVGAGISPTAMKRARAMMGGFASILINGNDTTGFVRIGSRGRRVKFRRGRLHVTTAADGAAFKARADEHRVNLRAVATMMELSLRKGGRAFLAGSWVLKRFMKMAKFGWVPEGTPGLKPGWTKSKQFGGTELKIVNNNPRSTLTPLGEAHLVANEENASSSIRLTSYVPGVMSVGTSRGLFTRAVASVTQDLEAYLARKEAEALADMFASLPRR